MKVDVCAQTVCLSWIRDGKICCLDRGLVDFGSIHGGG